MQLRNFKSQYNTITMNKNRFEKGFTLIELLIVIAIIGVLASLLTANYVSVRQRARDVQRKSDLSQVLSALELYRTDLGSYPSGPLPGCGQPLVNGGITYIKKVPCDPQGASYSYNAGVYFYIQSGGNTFNMGACLENSNDTGVNITTTSPGGTGSCASGKYYVVTNP